MSACAGAFTSMHVRVCKCACACVLVCAGARRHARAYVHASLRRERGTCSNNRAHECARGCACMSRTSVRAHVYKRVQVL
eukprot:483232-Pleurochrysis_carterae.AAC.3